jgi:hypothetical protein
VTGQGIVITGISEGALASVLIIFAFILLSGIYYLRRIAEALRDMAERGKQ